MREPLKWLLVKAFETTPKLVSQVTISVVATICAAFITNLYLQQPEPQAVAVFPPPAPVSLESRSGAELFQATFTRASLRSRPAYPTEFGAVFGPAPGKTAVVLEASGWSAPQAAPEPAVASDLQPKPRPVTRPPVASAHVLPPARPAPLNGAVIAELQAKSDRIGSGRTNSAQTKSDAASADDHLRLFGIPLPGFVPSGETVVKAVTSVGGLLTGAW